MMCWLSDAYHYDFEVSGYIKADKPEYTYIFRELSRDSTDCSLLTEYSFFFDDNNIYDLDSKGKFYKIAQKVPQKDSPLESKKYRYFYTTSQDSILYYTKINYIDFEHKSEDDRWFKDNDKITKLVYANNDVVYLYDNRFMNGTRIHRGKNLLEIKNYFIYLIMDDGKKFRSSKNAGNAFKENRLNGFMERNILFNSFSSELLSLQNPTPNNGMIINPDNTGVEIKDGMTEEQRLEAQKKEKEAEQKKEKEAYAYLCKQFGKTHVDAAFKGQITIGMSEKLLIATFKPTLKQTTGNKKQYYIYGWGVNNYSGGMNITNNKLKKIVWVTNGRVSSVKNVN